MSEDKNDNHLDISIENIDGFERLSSKPVGPMSSVLTAARYESNHIEIPPNA